MAFTAVLPAERLGEVLALLGDMWRAPTFGGLSIEKPVVAAELREDRRDLDVGLHARATFWPGHPLAQNVAGSAKVVKRARLADVRAWWSEISRLTNCHLSVAGDVDEDAIMEAAERSFAGCVTGGWLAPRPAPLFDRGPVVRHFARPDLSTTAVTFATGPLTPIEDAGLGILMSMLDDGLASRLSKRLTMDAGLAYRTRAGCHDFYDSSVIAVQAIAGPSRGARVLDELLAIVSELNDDLVGDEERDRTLCRWEFEARRACLDAEDIAELSGEAALYGQHYSEFERLRLARQLDAAALRDIARRLFRVEAMAVIAGGPRKHVRSIEEVVREWAS